VPLLLTIMVFAALGGIASAAVAVVFLWVREEHSVLILPHFISFATGALLGAALLALLPEAMAGAGPAGGRGIGLTLIAGLGVFFVIEKLVLWWHAHAMTLLRPPVRSTRTIRSPGATRSGTGTAPVTCTTTHASAPPGCWCWWATVFITHWMAR